jgi:multisubunit Na+/H+ antiporter MnhC subunit
MIGIIITSIVVGVGALVLGVFLHRNNKAKTEKVIDQAKVVEDKIKKVF